MVRKHISRRITKADKAFATRLDFRGIKFPVKISIGISVFGYESKKKYPIYLSKKCCKEKHVDLLLIGEGEKKHYVLINDFNRLIYDRSLHRGRKHFCCYCLHAFITEEILKHHIKDCFKINGKQANKMPKKGEYVKLKNFDRKIKSPFMIYAEIERILVFGENGKQNPNVSYTNKYQKHVACSYCYKLVCVDDKFNELLKSYLCEDAVYSFISSMVEQSKYCSNVMKKRFRNELVMTKKDNEDFENSAK